MKVSESGTSGNYEGLAFSVRKSPLGWYVAAPVHEIQVIVTAAHHVSQMDGCVHTVHDSIWLSLSNRLVKRVRQKFGMSFKKTSSMQCGFVHCTLARHFKVTESCACGRVAMSTQIHSIDSVFPVLLSPRHWPVSHIFKAQPSYSLLNPLNVLLCSIVRRMPQTWLGKVR